MQALPLVKTAALACATAAALSAPAVAAPPVDWVWFEAEAAQSTNFPDPATAPFAPANETEADVLSGGAWLSAGGDRTEPLYLEHRVSVPKTARYNFYARKFWHHGPFRFRWDDGPWTDVRKHALLDNSYIRQFLGANWAGLGEVQLTKGEHTLRVELLENKGAAAFDAFVLSPRGFVARGKLKPGQKLNRAQPGFFPFEPDEDAFNASPIDLRYLNEKAAGQTGFIRTRGENFVYGKTDRPVRFWAVNTGGDTVHLDAASIRLMARSLAKGGVNMIRLHGGIWKSDNWREVDREHLAKTQRFVRLMKAEGIYTCLSIYFPLWVRPDASLAGYAGDKIPFATLFFNPDFQAVYRNWWRELLMTPDPETGVALKDDPAVALAEIINEDSYFFFTFTPYQNVPAEQMEILERQFGDWASKRHGSTEAALKAWNAVEKGDDAGGGRVGVRSAWAMANVKDLRSRETIEFITQAQKKFFERERDHLRRLGFKAAIYGSNWVTADARVLGPLDKYTNTVVDVMDQHGYFSGAHTGERAGHSISTGDKYSDRSALLFKNDKGEDSFGLPLWNLRYNNLPATITEVNWTPPNRFRAEFPILAAAYGALQGTDGTFFFATGTPSWDQTLGKFSIRTPTVQGQFPAAALMFRQGLIKAAPVVAEVNLKLADLYAQKGAPVSGPVNLDDLRAKDIPPGQAAPVSQVNALDPLAFAVGKVGITFSESGGESKLADLNRFIDRSSKVVRSATGELSWDWGRGLATINAPAAQSVTGFLARGGRISLRDVTFSSPIEYGALSLVALDGLAIAKSRRMLLQVMSEESNFGWTTKPAENGLQEIESMGSAPLVVKEMAGTVALKRADAGRLKVTVLDANGYRKAAAGSARSISLRPNAMYYLIEAAGAAAKKS